MNDLWLPIPGGLSVSDRRQWLLGYAVSEIQGRADLSDYAEQTYLSETLQTVSTHIKQCEAYGDDWDPAVLAIGKYCNAILDASVDDAGERVLPKSIVDLQAARDAVLNVR